MTKILSKADLAGTIDQWRAEATVYGPVRRGDIIDFQQLTGSSDEALTLDANSRYPPKALFLPQSEAMFRMNGSGLEPVEAASSERIVLGIRPCDARACQLLDGVFAGTEYTDPYWSEKRRQTTLIALGCTDPCGTCFCTAVGSGPFDDRGADVMLNAAGLAFVAAGSRWEQADGQVMYVFILSMAAAEVAVGLALALRLYHRFKTLDGDAVREMRG